MDPQKSTPWSDTQKILALVTVVAFIAVIFVWMFFPPKTDQAATAVLNTLVGTLGGLVTMVLTFYFGSSRSSSAKDNTIAQLIAPPSGDGNGHPPASPPPLPSG